MKTYLCDNGQEITLRHVAPRLVMEILSKEEHLDPDPPYYEVEAAGDHTIKFKHDPTTLQTDEERKMWREYVAECARVDMVRQIALHHFLINVCIVDEPPPLEEWTVDYGGWGLEPPDPEDKKAYKIRWVEDVLCPAPEQIAGLLAELYSMSGLDEDRLKVIESFFRLALEGKTS